MMTTDLGRRLALTLVAPLGLVLMVASGSSANPIAFRVSGSIIQADGVDEVRVGESFEGILSYGVDLVPGTDPSSAGGRSYSGDVRFSFQTASRSFSITNPASSAIFVEDVTPGGRPSPDAPPGDNFGALIASGDPAASLQYLTLGMLDESGRVFDSTALPLVLDFSKFDTGVVVAYDGHNGIVSGIIERFEPVSIPEPGAVLVFGAAVVYYAFRVRRRRLG